MIYPHYSKQLYDCLSDHEVIVSQVKAKQE